MSRPHPIASALYLHVPFCRRKCAYCDFASWGMARGDTAMAGYVRALGSQLRELEACGMLEDVATAYVGGGTPSHLGAHVLADLLATAREQAPNLAEFTCEANPESLSDDVIDACRQNGVTRLSVGVQSLFDVELRALGRLHDAEQAKDRVRAALQQGFDLSCDLMCAIPEQDARSWQATLCDVVDLGVGHVSVYPLQIEEGTPLDLRYACDQTPWNDEEVQAARMVQARRTLEGAGYVRYEVASYARPGKECAHNRAYWTGLPYLAVGHAAASMLDATGYHTLRTCAPQLPELDPEIRRVRLTVTSPWESFDAHPRIADLHFAMELLDARQALAEDLMLGMRLVSGIDDSLIQRARSAFGDAFDCAVEALAARELVRWQSGRLVPTEAGWLLGNEVFGAMWSLAPGSITEVTC